MDYVKTWDYLGWKKYVTYATEMEDTQIPWNYTIVSSFNEVASSQGYEVGETIILFIPNHLKPITEPLTTLFGGRYNFEIRYGELEGDIIEINGHGLKILNYYNN